MIMGSAKNVRWIIPFKKFGMVRVNDVSLEVNILLISNYSYSQYDCLITQIVCSYEQYFSIRYKMFYLNTGRDITKRYLL